MSTETPAPAKIQAIAWLIVRGRRVTLCRDRPSDDTLAYAPGCRLVDVTDPEHLDLTIDELTARYIGPESPPILTSGLIAMAPSYDDQVVAAVDLALKKRGR